MFDFSGGGGGGGSGSGSGSPPKDNPWTFPDTSKVPANGSTMEMPKLFVCSKCQWVHRTQVCLERAEPN